jgi:hypothetical protein
MARKRGPGGGRKPRGEFKGKTAMLTTRITPETRGWLESAAQKSGRSLSQEVEYRLRQSLTKNRDRRKDVLALGEAIAMLLQCVERATKAHWRDDAFTCRAFQHGIEFLISHFGARETLAVPPSVKGAAAEMPPALAKRYSSAKGVGVTEAGRVITLIESWNDRDIFDDHRVSRSIPGGHFPEEWYTQWQLLGHLGSGWKRTQRAKDRSR